MILVKRQESDVKHINERTGSPAASWMNAEAFVLDWWSPKRAKACWWGSTNTPACVPSARRVPPATDAQLQPRESKGSSTASGTELFVVLFCFVLLSENPQCNSIPKLPDDYRKFKIYAICLLGVLHNISFRFQCWVLNYSSQTKELLQDRCW